MKTLILTAGLPGTGKSTAARNLNILLKGQGYNSYYFDSDKFAKTVSMEDVNYKTLSDREMQLKRIESQKLKIQEIAALFQKYEIIILDTCFDIPAARELYYDLEKSNIRIIILEVTCSESIALSRIQNATDYHRIPGDISGRIDMYKKMKKSWKPIKHKNHIIINSENELESQLKAVIYQLKI